MCETYNTIGSLTTLKAHLIKNNIHDFKSLKEVIDFQNNYTTLRQQIISHHENLIEQEKNMLKIDLQELDKEIETQRLQSKQKLNDEIDKLNQQFKILATFEPTNFFQKITKYLKQLNNKRKINNRYENFDFEVNRSIKKLNENHQTKNNRYQFINSQCSEAVNQSSRLNLLEIDRKKTIIDGLSSFIYGSLGEQKVVKTLEALSDDCFLINDFEVSFSPAIYNKNENDYIKSVQIDHILVTPSGIFLIETKNWSEKSLENLNLRSPVQQIKRTSFVLFKLLNNEIANYHLNLDKHHWGNRKISIRNLIVLINTKPKEEFQYVKILTLNELLGYINYFKTTYSSDETQRITKFLLAIDDQKRVNIS